MPDLSLLDLIDIDVATRLVLRAGFRSGSSLTRASRLARVFEGNADLAFKHEHLQQVVPGDTACYDSLHNLCRNGHARKLDANGAWWSLGPKARKRSCTETLFDAVTYYPIFGGDLRTLFYESCDAGSRTFLNTLNNLASRGEIRMFGQPSQYGTRAYWIRTGAYSDSDIASTLGEVL